MKYIDTQKLVSERHVRDAYTCRPKCSRFINNVISAWITWIKSFLCDTEHIVIIFFEILLLRSCNYLRDWQIG
jgi:hypothetical protein